jgi:hypothetical protein
MTSGARSASLPSTSGVCGAARRLRPPRPPRRRAGPKEARCRFAPQRAADAPAAPGQAPDPAVLAHRSQARGFLHPSLRWPGSASPSTDHPHLVIVRCEKQAAGSVDLTRPVAAPQGKPLQRGLGKRATAGGGGGSRSGGRGRASALHASLRCVKRPAAVWSACAHGGLGWAARGGARTSQHLTRSPMPGGAHAVWTCPTESRLLFRHLRSKRVEQESGQGGRSGR